MNHYAELTNHKLMGGNTVTVCLEDIAVLADHGSDGVSITLHNCPPNSSNLECTEPYAYVYDLLKKAIEDSTLAQLSVSYMPTGKHE